MSDGRLDARFWVAFHDVPLSQANVDHVAIGPRRVYARARAQREVVPVLVLWGSSVRRSRGEAPAMVSGTRVVVGAAARDWLARMSSAAGSVLIDHPAISSVEAILGRAEEQEHQELVAEGIAR